MIVKTTIEELDSATNLAELIEAYSAESAIEGMPKYSVCVENYKAIEAAGLLHVFAAYEYDKLIGFLCMLVTYIPHYSAKIASTESFFVSPEYRRTGAGLRLLRQAESYAAELGAVGMFVSAPIGGKLADVMSASLSYKETNRVFFKGFGHV